MKIIRRGKLFMGEDFVGNIIHEGRFRWGILFVRENIRHQVKNLSLYPYEFSLMIISIPKTTMQCLCSGEDNLFKGQEID